LHPARTQMRLLILAGFLLSSCVNQTAALALLSRQEAELSARDVDVDKRALSAAVLVPSLETIYSTGDVTKRKTAGFGFNFQIDYGQRLWGFCPVEVEKLEDCLTGSCFDDFACSTGCGHVGQSAFSTITWQVHRLFQRQLRPLLTPHSLVPETVPPSVRRHS
jgi:hypothetical protein